MTGLEAVVAVGAYNLGEWIVKKLKGPDAQQKEAKRIQADERREARKSRDARRDARIDAIWEGRRNFAAGLIKGQLKLEGEDSWRKERERRWSINHEAFKRSEMRFLMKPSSRGAAAGGTSRKNVHLSAGHLSEKRYLRSKKRARSLWSPLKGRP
jgi:hypothetical protein